MVEGNVGLGHQNVPLGGNSAAVSILRLVPVGLADSARNPLQLTEETRGLDSISGVPAHPSPIFFLVLISLCVSSQWEVLLSPRRGKFAGT